MGTRLIALVVVLGVALSASAALGQCGCGVPVATQQSQAGLKDRDHTAKADLGKVTQVDRSAIAASRSHSAKPMCRKGHPRRRQTAMSNSLSK